MLSVRAELTPWRCLGSRQRLACCFENLTHQSRASTLNGCSLLVRIGRISPTCAAGIYVAIKNNVDVEHLLIKYGLLKGDALSGYRIT